MRALVLVVAILSSLTLLPTAAVGQASVEDAVRQAIPIPDDITTSELLSCVTCTD